MEEKLFFRLIFKKKKNFESVPALESRFRSVGDICLRTHDVKVPFLGKPLSAVTAFCRNLECLKEKFQK